MKELDLTPYEVPGIPGKVDPKTALGNMLYRPELKLSARDLLAQAALVEKIETAGDSVLLEDAEYARVKKAFETVTGYGRGDLPLVRRVLEAPDVAVEKAKPAKPD